MNAKWEYKIDLTSTMGLGSNPNLKPINDAGKEGWELVSVIPMESGGYRLFYKRPLS